MAGNLWHRLGHHAGRFHLLRYFTVTGLIAFLVVAAAVYYLERRESNYFRQVQREQVVFVTQLQERFAREQERSARRDFLLAHESQHVTLTRLLGNAFWGSHLEHFLAATRQVFDRCRKPAQTGGAVAAATPPSSACYAESRRRILASREFQALDRKLAEAVKNTPVFKIKIFDEQGMTIYSSEVDQIGEDKRSNAGWSAAVQGRAASELTYRDKFSAFEGVVEKRDLISSYVPLFDHDGTKIIGVFEIYSDVTPLLKSIKSTSTNIAALAAADREKLEQVAKSNQRNVDKGSYVMVAIIGGLLATLYLVLLLLVRHAQRIIDAQARAQERSIRREERWHREKMSVLATMAATVGHEIGNPLATIVAVADDMALRQAEGARCDCRADLILEQTRRIAAKTRQMADFATARGESAEPIDVNHIVQAVCEFLSFDRRFARTAIEFRPAVALPARVLVADHLTEAVMNLLQAYVESDDEGRQPPRRIMVETREKAENVLIRMSCDADADFAVDTINPRVESTRRRVAGIGGRFAINGTVCEIALPAAGRQ